MALHDINQISDTLKYRDYYLLEEDEMGDNSAQSRLIKYIVEVLEWYYRKQGWFIAPNLDLYHPKIDNPQNRIAPDLAVFKDIYIPAEEQANMGSWNMMNLDKPCPPWILEASSKDTYTNDIFLDRKVKTFGLIGVREYFVYDPNVPQVWPKRIESRVIGWKYDYEGNPSPIRANDDGWLWSEVLESWLVADGRYLRLYDRDENLRLTKAEAQERIARAEFIARQEAEEKAKAETEARKLAEKQAQAEAQARQEAEKQAKAEEKARLKAEERAKAEAKRAELEATTRKEVEEKAKAETQARQEIEKQLAELQRQLEELRRNKDND